MTTWSITAYEGDTVKFVFETDYQPSRDAHLAALRKQKARGEITRFEMAERP